MREARRILADREYERHLRLCVRRRERPERPQSREQWRMALRYYPTLKELWEAPAEPEPLDEEFVERLLITVRDNERFARALKYLLEQVQ